MPHVLNALGVINIILQQLKDSSRNLVFSLEVNHDSHTTLRLNEGGGWIDGISSAPALFRRKQENLHDQTPFLKQGFGTVSCLGFLLFTNDRGFGWTLGVETKDAGSSY